MIIQKFMYDEIYTAFDDCQKLIVYNNGNKKEITKDTQEYDKIMQLWQVALKNSYEMPAYGVSLDKETREAMQTGFYIEFVFDDTKTHNQMHFDTLLVELVNNQGGYQLIRHHDGIYEGRCYYINLSDINNDLYNFIASLSK